MYTNVGSAEVLELSRCKQALLSLASSKKQYDAIEASTPPKEV